MNLRFSTISIAIIVLFTFVVFSLNLVDLQVINGDYYRSFSDRLVFNDDSRQQYRGLFFDRDGALLVKNTSVFTVEVANIAKMDTVKELLPAYKINDLAKIGNLSSSEFIKVANKLEESGVEFQYFENFRRDYKYPEYFSHILGYTGLASEDDLQRGYSADDYIGKYKLESQLEDYLKGVDDKKIIIDGVEYFKKGEVGSNVFLTIDKDWQVSLYKIIEKYSKTYGAAGGAGVIVDDSDGDIVSLVSYPGFDSNLLVRGIDQESYNNLLNRRDKPLLDKAIGLAATPGSTFKIITSHSLLQNKIIDINSRFYSNRCMQLGGGYEFCEFGKFFYGDMNVVRALYKSSNLFFCNYLLQDYRVNGLNNLLSSASDFNIAQKTGIDLVGEVSGNMDSPEYKRSVANDGWFDGDTCNVAIGQGAILVTPIQLAMVASTINNNGVYYKPNIIEKIEDVYGNVIFNKKVEVKRTVDIEENTLNYIKEGLKDVAQNPEGTVYVFLSDVPGNLRVKTGTAEVYERVNGVQEYRTHGWIVGTFDYDNKSYSFAFHLNYGGGGFYISQVARDFVNCLYSNFNECL